MPSSAGKKWRESIREWVLLCPGLPVTDLFLLQQRGTHGTTSWIKNLCAQLHCCFMKAPSQCAHTILHDKMSLVIKIHEETRLCYWVNFVKSLPKCSVLKNAGFKKALIFQINLRETWETCGQVSGQVFFPPMRLLCPLSLQCKCIPTIETVIFVILELNVKHVSMYLLQVSGDYLFADTPPSYPASRSA